ncbi:hypothetical protein CLV60_1251, partial [Dyadobacter jiangsuensis]
TYLFALFIMSKNVASDFPKLVALIVFSAVVPRLGVQKWGVNF